MKLSKWHGLGNDYLLVERAELPVPLTPQRVRRICDYHLGVGCGGLPEAPSLLAERAERPVPLTPQRVRRICDYHFGVGSDGILEVLSFDGDRAEVVIW